MDNCITLQISQRHISSVPDTVHGGNQYEKDVGSFNMILYYHIAPFIPQIVVSHVSTEYSIFSSLDYRKMYTAIRQSIASYNLRVDSEV